MSLQLLNDFILDIKCNSIQTTIPIAPVIPDLSISINKLDAALQNQINNPTLTIPDNSILNVKLFNKTVDNTKIKDNTIINALIADDAVTNTKILNNTIDINKLDAALQSQITNPPLTIPDNSILNVKLFNKTVDNTKIKDNTIINALIADDAVTNTKIINDAVTNTKIINDAVTTTKIIDNSITNNKLQGNSVTTTKILDNTITAVKLQGNCVITSKILDNNVTNAKLFNKTVDNTKIKDNTIINSLIVDNTITNDKLFNKTINNTKIADGTINSSLLATDIAISGDLDVGGNLNVPTGSITGNIVNAITELNSYRINTTSITINNNGAYLTQGSGVLTGGAVSIYTTAIESTSIVLLTRTDDPQAAHAGFLAVTLKDSGNYFDVFSSKSSDIGTFDWVILNPVI